MRLRTEEPELKFHNPAAILLEGTERAKIQALGPGAPWLKR
jgi:hypothetical protein